MARIVTETLVPLQEPLSEEVIALSALDQQAQRNYAKLLLAFEYNTTTSTVDDAIKSLQGGLKVALSENPDFAAKVVPVAGSTRKELELHVGPDSGVPLRVADYATKGQNAWQYGSYTKLATNHFPVADIPSQQLFVDHPTAETTPATGIPALTIQLNLLGEGLLMGICWHHTVGDAHSLNVLLRSWAHHTKTSNLGHNDGPAHQTRSRWILNTGPGDVTVDRLLGYVVDSTVRSPIRPEAAHLLDRPSDATVSCTISTWYFGAPSLQRLRTLMAGAATVDSTKGEAGETGFTQSEALAALTWKHLSQARQLDRHLTDSTWPATSLFTTRLDYRSRMKPALSDDFLGNINEPNGRARVSLEEVCAPSTPESLATLAQAVRSAVQSLGEEDVRMVIGLVNQLPAVTDLTWAYDVFPGPDLSVTDMSSFDTLRQDWGSLLGFPATIRAYSRERGLVYVLPQDRNGGLQVQLQCEAEALQALKASVTFRSYARFQC